MNTNGFQSGIRFYVGLVFISILFCNSLFSLESQCPALMKDYRPPKDQLLAETGSEKITDTDLLLYLAMDKSRHPNIFNRYVIEEDLSEKGSLLKKIREEITALFVDRQLAMNAPAPEEGPRINNLRLRIESYPLYELVWVEEILSPMVEIKKEDVIGFYRRHQERYTDPPQVKIRIMFLPAPEELSELQRQKINTQIEKYHDMVSKADDFTSLVLSYSTPYPGSTPEGIMEIVKGDSYNRFFDEAYDLKQGDLSPVFQTEEGYFFLKLLEKQEPSEVPLSSVEEEIRRQLHIRSIQYLYELEWEKLDKKYKPYTRVTPWSEMKDDQILIRVADLEITKGEFLSLYPEVITETFDVDDTLKGVLAGKIHQYECIRAEVENRGLGAHSCITKGLPIAENRIAAKRRIDEFLDPLKIPSEEDLKEFYENKPDIGRIMAWREVKHLVGEISRFEQRNSQEQFEIIDRMEKDFEQIISDARKIISEEIQKKEGEKWFPSVLFAKLLQKYSQPDYQFVIYDLGRVTKESNPDIWPDISLLSPGEFTSPRKVKGFIYSYYIERSNKGRRKPFDEVKEEVEAKYLEERLFQAERALREKILENVQIKYKPILQ